MKKTILTFGIGIIVIVAFIFGMQFLKTMKSKASTAAQNARLKAATASTKAKILELSLLIEEWHEQNEQSYADFTAHQQNNKKVKDSINAIEREKNILLDYFIASTNKNYVIRLKPSNKEKVYCFDSSSLNVFETVSSNRKIFRTKAYCNGSPL